MKNMVILVLAAVLWIGGYVGTAQAQEFFEGTCESSLPSMQAVGIEVVHGPVFPPIYMAAFTITKQGIVPMEWMFAGQPKEPGELLAKKIVQEKEEAVVIGSLSFKIKGKEEAAKLIYSLALTDETVMQQLGIDSAAFTLTCTQNAE